MVLKRFIIYFFILCGMLLFQVSSAIGGPHMVYGTVKHSDGSIPPTIHFGAFVVNRSAEILTENSFGCGTNNGTWYIQCGNFPTPWSVGEILHVDLDDGGTKEGSIELILTTNVGDAGDNAGIVTLTQPPNDVKLSMPDTTVLRGISVSFPLYIEGLQIADSVVAYELTIGFDSAVLQAIGATSQGTMTQNWGDPFVGPKTDSVRIAGFTTNEPSKRLVNDDGILVYVNFLVHGIPTNPFSNSTIVYLIRGKIYTLYDQTIISHSKSGTITVQENPTQVTEDLTLYPEWNQVSLPLIPEDNTFPEVFNGIPVGYVRAFYYGENYRTWASGRPSWANDLHRMDGIHGYEMRLDTSVSMILHATGEHVEVNTPIILYEDWNLMAFLPNSVYGLEHALQSLDTLYISLIEYNAEFDAWKTWGRGKPEWANDLNELSPFLGYWIRMDAGGTLVYPSSPVPKMASNDEEKIESMKMSPPKSCDFWGYQPGLLIPGDSIHVIDHNNIICGKTEILPEGGFLVHVFGDDPTTMNADEGAEEGEFISFKLNGKAIRVTGASQNSKSPLESGRLVFWEDRESKQVQFKVDEPDHPYQKENKGSEDFYLSQNYPNPFNATTVIQYDLPYSCCITVQILNSQGQVVCILVNDRLEKAGQHRVIWNGLDNHKHRASSGIYFYRLTAGDFLMTRKMILLY